MKRYSKICFCYRSDGCTQKIILLCEDIPVRTNIYRLGQKAFTIHEKDEIRNRATLNFSQITDNSTMVHA